MASTRCPSRTHWRMSAATAPWAGPPPKSPKATKPDIGWTVSKVGSPTGCGAVVAVVAVEVDVEAAGVAPFRRVELQAVRKPVARSPSICRRLIRPAGMGARYRGPDGPRERPPGQSGGLWPDRPT